MIEAIKDANPKMSLVAIDFWNKLAVQDEVSLNENLRQKIFER